MNRLRSHSRCQSSNGFTIVETITTVSILAILAAVALPAMAGAIANQYTRLSQIQAQSLLVILKREAQRTNRSCQVTFTGSLATVDPPDCLVSTGRSLSDSGLGVESGVIVEGTLTSVTFSPKATVTPSSNGTLRFSHPWSPISRCLVISQPLGVIRLGTIANNTCVKEG